MPHPAVHVVWNAQLGVHHMVAARHIAEGEEIAYHYGANYWEALVNNGDSDASDSDMSDSDVVHIV